MNIFSSILVLLFLSNLNASSKSDFYFKDEAKKLSEKQIRKFSTTLLDVKEAQVLFDNDLALNAKLAVIDHAEERYIEKGSSDLYLTYYIFSEDESSSYFALKIIEAAKLGVKIHINLDFLQAYPKLDFYRWMAKEGMGNIQFYFYGKPTESIMLDMLHLGSPCIKDGVNLIKFSKGLTACTEYKKQRIGNSFKVSEFKASDPKYQYASLLLSGMYAKNPKIIVKALLEANQISLNDIIGDDSTAMDPETKESLKEFLKLIYQTKTSDGLERIFLSLKLKMALARYGEQLQPLYNLLTGLLPLTSVVDSNDQDNDGHQRDWYYFTDYTHHKIILSNGEKLVMGGRNIENSYHMQANRFSSKYIFMDSDISIQLNQKNADLIESQRKISQFSDLVISLEDLVNIMPNDLDAAMSLAEEICGTQATVTNPNCIDEKTLEYSQSSEKRFLEIAKRSTKRAKDYLTYEQKPSSPAIELDQTAKVYYVENLHFDPKDSKLKRIYGVKESNKDFASVSKAINELWLRKMESQCSSGKPELINLYNAYFIPPANFSKLLAKMVDGTLNCSNVEIRLITNSMETTDLGVINIFARHWLKEFSQYLANFQEDSRSAKVKYYEYNKDELVKLAQDSEKGSYSLHSKLSTFGDSSFLLGSANLDIRSYARDTNNAVLVEAAPESVAKIGKFIEDRIANSMINQIPFEQFNMSDKQLEQIDYGTLQYINISKCLKKQENPGSGCEYLDESQFESAFGIFSSITKRLDDLVKDIIVSPLTFERKLDVLIPDVTNRFGRETIRQSNRTQRKAMDKYDYVFGFL